MHNEKAATSKPSYIFEPGPLRLSLSPHKIKTSKKFFYQPHIKYIK